MVHGASDNRARLSAAKAVLTLNDPLGHKTRLRRERLRHRWTVSLGDISFRGRCRPNERTDVGVDCRGLIDVIRYITAELWPRERPPPEFTAAARINSIRMAPETQFRHATCSAASTARDVVRFHGSRRIDDRSTASQAIFARFTIAA